MKYLSIDLESTGLDPDTCNIIEFAAVLDDTKAIRPIESLPRFHRYVLPPSGRLYHGEPGALAMHATAFGRIAARMPGYEYCYPGELGAVVRGWLTAQGVPPEDHVNVAGKNFGSFDLRFLQIAGFTKYVRIRHRIFDPGTAFFRPDDDELPGSKTCMERAGIVGDVMHTAMDDALAVVQMVRAVVEGRCK